MPNSGKEDPCQKPACQLQVCLDSRVDLSHNLRCTCAGVLEEEQLPGGELPRGDSEAGRLLCLVEGAILESLPGNRLPRQKRSTRTD